LIHYCVIANINQCRHTSSFLFGSIWIESITLFDHLHICDTLICSTFLYLEITFIQWITLMISKTNECHFVARETNRAAHRSHFFWYCIPGCCSKTTLLDFWQNNIIISHHRKCCFDINYDESKDISVKLYYCTTVGRASFW
jgi:hypothetical protein